MIHDTYLCASFCFYFFILYIFRFIFRSNIWGEMFGPRYLPHYATLYAAFVPSLSITFHSLPSHSFCFYGNKATGRLGLQGFSLLLLLQVVTSHCLFLALFLDSTWLQTAVLLFIEHLTDRLALGPVSLTLTFDVTLDSWT